MDNMKLTSELTGPSAEHVRNISLIAAVLGASPVSGSLDENIDAAVGIYMRVAERYMLGLAERGERVLKDEGI